MNFSIFLPGIIRLDKILMNISLPIVAKNFNPMNLNMIFVFQLQKVIILRSTPLFFIIRVLMLLDIINIIVSKIHDIPDDFANRELFGNIFFLLLQNNI